MVKIWHPKYVTIKRDKGKIIEAFLLKTNNESNESISLINKVNISDSIKWPKPKSDVYLYLQNICFFLSFVLK